MTPGPREWTLGTHTLRFEPPDVLWMKFRGPITLEHAVLIRGVYEEMRAVLPIIFVAEMKETGALDPEAGRYLSENLHSAWSIGNIYIGARLLHRALAKGLALASLLTKHRDDRALEKIHHVPTEAEARALIARLRAQKQGPGA